MFSIVTKKDSSFTVLGRITAKNGSGAASPTASEGNLVQQADISSISIKQLDASGNEISGRSATPSVSDVIHDTLQTSGIWGAISGGGNFEWDGEYSWAATAGEFILRVEIDYTGGEQTVDCVSWRIE